MPCHAPFEIDIVSALANQLESALGRLSLGLLDLRTIGSIEATQGVYLLYHHDVLVYVGKAKQLRKRLAEHHQKICGRRNISIDTMKFKCLYVHRNWTALAPEETLIKHFKGKKGNLAAWNGMSFGPHDPGRERETTNKETHGFDQLYPIKDDWACEGIKAGEWNARELLLKMKAELPYLLRFQLENRKRYQMGHPDYNDVVLEVPRHPMTARELLALVAKSLPGWQATMFPSHAILYKESRVYTHGEVIWPHPSA